MSHDEGPIGKLNVNQLTSQGDVTFGSDMSVSDQLTAARMVLSFGGNALTINGGDISLAAASGTKIGTATGQKIGFWNTTPVVQQVLASGSSANDIIAFLQTVGLCKES